jgi:hypothetical protein
MFSLAFGLHGPRRTTPGTIAASGTYDRVDRLSEIGVCLNTWARYAATLVSGRKERAGRQLAFPRPESSTEAPRRKRPQARGPTRAESATC